MKNNLRVFFSEMFPELVLKNVIVATIVFNLGIIFSDLQDRINQDLNTDI